MSTSTLFIATIIKAFALLRFLSFVAGQTFEIDTVVGHRFYQGDGGLASHVAVHYPRSVALHPVTEDLFFVDSGN